MPETGWLIELKPSVVKLPGWTHPIEETGHLRP